MDTFISYTSDIEENTGKIKEYLDQFGFSCFLAHENIPPQRKWPAEIVDALKRSDLFVPLLTPKFRASYYCQQETGFAVSRGTEILPIMISIEPMGTQ